MSAHSIFEAFLAGQGYALFEYLGDGDFRVLGEWPDWCANIWGAQPHGDQLIGLADRSPFLENFLVDAEEFWRAHLPGSANSGNWIERGTDGHEIPLEATARLLAGKRILLLQNLSETFAQQQQWFQTARNSLLEHEKLLKEIQKKEILLHCIVHDLTQPLSAMNGVFNLLNRETLPARLRKYLKAGERESQRQELMIRGILEAFSSDLAAQQARETSPAQAPDLLVCAKQAIEEFSPAFRERGIRLSLGAPADGSRGWRVVGDSSRMDRIFGNLLENAMRYAPRGTAVTIGLESQSGLVAAFVDDEGPGLPPEQRPDQLFALFSKGKSHAGKAGLGLYFCKITVERWGGTIGAETRAGGGSRFWFRLPRAAQSTQNDLTAATRDRSVEKEKTHKLKKTEKSLRILVAEDAELNRDLIIELLKKRGHVVQGVADGRRALAALEEHDFDVVLLDEEMPGMTGLQTTAAIRRREATTLKHQIIIGISGHATADDEHRFREAGMDASLAKPVEVTTLYKAVEAAAQNLPPTPPPSQRAAESGPAIAPSAALPTSAAPQPPADPSPNSPLSCEGVAAHLRRTTGGNEKLVRSLAGAFLADGAKTLARIRGAIAKKNAAELARAAHLLRGSLAIFGAAKAVAAARHLEALGRANSLRDASAGLHALESEFAPLERELRAISSVAKPRTQSPAKSRAATRRPRRKK
jgi:signal transduction histidine kinase/DNA-binding NarL/FixJ family response regulator/HPt (histidine-containing phosphotransfer) domain-containing protein